MKFKVNLKKRIKFLLDGVEQDRPMYDNVLVYFGTEGYKSFLTTNPSAFPFEGEMVYGIRKVGLKNH